MITRNSKNIIKIWIFWKNENFLNIIIIADSVSNDNHRLSGFGFSLGYICDNPCFSW